MTSQNMVNIGSGNGLLAESTKSLPEPTLTNHKWGLLAFTWEKFHIKCSRDLMCVWKLLIQDYSYIIQEPMSQNSNVKASPYTSEDLCTYLKWK